MSWNTSKKRFQKDAERMTDAMRQAYLKDQAKKYMLPTWDIKYFDLRKKDQVSFKKKGFVAGDLVYIVDGEKKGEITKIFHYTSSNDCVILANSKAKRLVPKSRFIERQTSHLMDYPEYTPASNVRLVGKDKDESGKVSYLVADEIVLKDEYYDDRYKCWLPKRLVKHHEHIEIPWPLPAQEYQDDALSTPTNVAHEKTYELQSLAKSPLPLGVLHELRNRYSKHKTRMLNSLDISKLNAPDMPLTKEQKIYLANIAKKPAKKPLEPLSEEIKDFIGDRIASHISKIDNPHLLSHLDAVSNLKAKGLEETLAKIEQNNNSVTETENKTTNEPNVNL